MNETVFCYHCRRQHPAAESTLVLVHGRQRWRCTKSLLASATSRQERDAFGLAVTERNRERRPQAASEAPMRRWIGRAADSLAPEGFR